MASIPIPDINIGAIGPEITLCVIAMGILMAEVFSPSRKNRDLMGLVAFGGVVVAGLITMSFQGESFTTFSGTYIVDNFSTFFKLICLLATGLTILVSIRYCEEENIHEGEYYALLLFTTVGMLFMASGEDLMTIYMGLEVMSLSLYALAGYTKTRRESNEASLKYFILGGFSSAILLYGMALIYGASGTTKLAGVSEALMGGSVNTTLIAVGVVLTLVGFAFKVSAVPFHMWTPDVYQGAPVPITGFMSAGPKAAAFAAMFRLFAEAFAPLQNDWWLLLWILAAVTMTAGNLFALAQNNVKRMLAYSSIAHAGYILMGVAAANETGSSGALFYLLAYTFMNIAAFAIVGIVASKGEERVSFKDYTGLGYKYPLLGATLTVMIFSLAGIPPTAGFVGKFYIFMAVVEKGYIVLAIIGVLNAVISVFYYLKLTVYMYMRDERVETTKIVLQPSMIIALLLSLYGVLIIGLAPSAYMSFAKSAFLSF